MLLREDGSNACTRTHVLVNAQGTEDLDDEDAMCIPAGDAPCGTWQWPCHYLHSYHPGYHHHPGYHPATTPATTPVTTPATTPATAFEHES
jgi:hypothetical protein